MTLHYQLMRTHTALGRRIFARAQKELGLSSGQPKVLDALLENEGSDQKTLAKLCEIEQATLGNIIMRMEENGLVERRQKAGNRRSFYIYLTEHGKTVAEQMKVIFDEEDTNALQLLSKDEQQLAEELLDKIWQGINNISGGDKA